MALLHFDGFDHYRLDGSTAANQIQNCNPTMYDTNNANTGTAQGRPLLRNHPVLPGLGLYVGGGAGSHTNANFGAYILPYTPVSGDTLGVGCHVYPSDISSSSTNKGGFLGLSDNTAQMLTSGLYLQQAGSGNLILNGNVLGTFPALTQGVLYHFELKTYFHATEGEVSVRIDGVDVLTVSGLNTLSFPCTRVRFLTGSGSSVAGDIEYFYDNLYVWDGTGVQNNDWLGDRSVIFLPVNSDGSSQDWSLSSGSDAYDLLDNVPPDPSTDYIETSTLNAVSSFGVADLEHDQHDIAGVALWVQAQKTDSGDSDITLDIDGETTPPTSLTEQPLYFSHVVEVDPNTAAQWEATDVNDIVVAVEKVL